MTTPAERLLRAAEVLESRASEATEGPWRVDNEIYPEVIYGQNDNASVISGSRWGGDANVFDNDADARYIATVHPGVGKQLAKMLRDEAHWSDLYDRAAMDYGVSQELLALADLVLEGAE